MQVLGSPVRVILPAIYCTSTRVAVPLCKLRPTLVVCADCVSGPSVYIPEINMVTAALNVKLMPHIAINLLANPAEISKCTIEYNRYISVLGAPCNIERYLVGWLG